MSEVEFINEKVLQAYVNLVLLVNTIAVACLVTMDLLYIALVFSISVLVNLMNISISLIAGELKIFGGSTLF